MVAVLRIETSGVAQVGQPHGLSCIVTEGSGDLTWTDSSGWVHNSSNGSQSGLELVFPSLELSNVGLYTCRVTLANGDFREVTKEILAVGKILQMSFKIPLNVSFFIPHGSAPT